MRRIPQLGATLAFVFFLLAASLPAAATDTPKELFERGTKHLRNGDLAGAIQDLTAVITDDSTPASAHHAEAYNNRGLAYFRQENFDLAQDDFEAAISLDADNGKAYNNLANVHYERGDYAQALDNYRKSLPPVGETTEPSQLSDPEPYFADVYNNMGIIHERQGSPSQAMTAYNNAIQVKTDLVLDYTAAYYNRGNLRYDQKQFDLAIDDYSVTINFYTQAKDTTLQHLADAYYNRGLAHYNLSDYAQAIADYDRAIAIRPDFVWAHYSKGYAHFMRGEYNTALASFQQVEDLIPTHPNHPAIPWNHLATAFTYQNRGQSGDEIRYLENLTKSCDLGNDSACALLK